jgi:hypothetical protein
MCSRGAPNYGQNTSYPAVNKQPLREAYLYTHQRFIVDLSRPISPATLYCPQQLLEARIEALRGPPEPP